MNTVRTQYQNNLLSLPDDIKTLVLDKLDLDSLASLFRTCTYFTNLGKRVGLERFKQDKITVIISKNPFITHFRLKNYLKTFESDNTLLLELTRLCNRIIAPIPFLDLRKMDQRHWGKLNPKDIPFPLMLGCDSLARPFLVLNNGKSVTFIQPIFNDSQTPVQVFGGKDLGLSHKVYLENMHDVLKTQLKRHFDEPSNCNENGSC